MLLQSIYGALSIYYLSYFFLRLKLSSGFAHIVSLVTFSILLIPWSPLQYYLVTFIKDSFFAFSLCWLIALILNFIRVKVNVIQFNILYSLLTILLVFCLSSRHNALILFPLILFSQYMILKTRQISLRKMIVYFSMPWILFFGVKKINTDFFEIQKTYPFQQVIAQDLISMVYLKPDIRKNFPYLNSNLKSNYLEGFEWGNVHRIYFEDTIVNEEYRYGNEMTEEYMRAILHYPLLFIKTKWLNFQTLLSFEVPHNWFYLGVDKQDIAQHGSIILTKRSEKLIQNTTFNKIRSKIFYFSIAISDNMSSRLFSGINAVWLIINILSIFVLIFFIIKTRINPFSLIIILFPFLYYFSYLVATTAHDFRFMYPATLVVQTLFLSFLFSCILNLKTLFKDKIK